MLYQEAKAKNGKVVITKSKQVNQNELTNDCWLIQINGLSACEICEAKDTDECSGQAIREQLLQ